MVALTFADAAEDPLRKPRPVETRPRIGSGV
jgi:hypothetical protein